MNNIKIEIVSSREINVYLKIQTIINVTTI